MIRLLEKEDIPPLVEMGRAFAALVDKPVTYSPERTESVLIAMMENATPGAPNSVVFVFEEAGIIEGVILGAMAPVWFAEEWAAIEVALWVQPDSRGGKIARKLIEAFEAWGKSMGASFSTMSDLCIGGEYPASGLFERLGYRQAERSWIKEV